eukprot:COSAG01_NODE_3160_length_6484_cov_3.337510_6_plen_167_part_00
MGFSVSDHRPTNPHCQIERARPCAVFCLVVKFKRIHSKPHRSVASHEVANTTYMHGTHTHTHTHTHTLPPSLGPSLPLSTTRSLSLYLPPSASLPPSLPSSLPQPLLPPSLPMNMNRSVFTRIPITRYGTQRAVHSRGPLAGKHYQPAAAGARFLLLLIAFQGRTS